MAFQVSLLSWNSKFYLLKFGFLSVDYRPPVQNYLPDNSAIFPNTQAKEGEMIQMYFYNHFFGDLVFKKFSKLSHTQWNFIILHFSPCIWDAPSQLNKPS